MKKIILLSSILSTVLLANSVIELKTMGNVTYGHVSIKGEIQNDKNQPVERTVNYGNTLTGGLGVTAYKNFEISEGVDLKLGLGLEGGYGRVVKLIDDESGAVKKNREIYETMKKDYEEIKADPNSTEEDKKSYADLIATMEKAGQEAHFYHGYVSPYASAEISKKVNDDFKVYLGANLGTIHYFSPYFAKDKQVLGKKTDLSKNHQYSFNAKGILGLTYQEKYSAELQFGNPGYVSLGFGARFEL